MPNGKGSTDWGKWPTLEELIVGLICFVFILILTKNLGMSSLVGIAGVVIMLWTNNGWPGPWNNFGKREGK